MEIRFEPLASGSGGNLAVVSDGESRLVLDCGVAPRDLGPLLGHRISELDGCLLSHSHGDHVCGAGELARRGVDLWASFETIASLGRNGHHRGLVLEPRKVAEIPSRAGGGRWRVLPFELSHDVDGTLGFLVERRGQRGDLRGTLLYACDTAYVPWRFEGVNILAIECNYSESLLMASPAPIEQRKRVLQAHLSLERLLDFLRSLDLRLCEEIWLLHLSPRHSDAAGFREAVAAATGKPTFIAPERTAAPSAARSAPRIKTND